MMIFLCKFLNFYFLQISVDSLNDKLVEKESEAAASVILDYIDINLVMIWFGAGEDFISIL